MRLEVTRKAELAVRALTTLADTDRLKAGELAARLESTPGFVAQVVNPLVKQGWVRSIPGPTGGYTLTPEVDDLSVLAVVEAVDGPTETGRCVAAERACGAAQACALHHAWVSARRELLRQLADTPAIPHRTAPTPSSR